MPSYIYLILYKLKELSREEEEKARMQWEDMMKEWPPEVRLIGVYDHAWGTEYNGVMILESDSMDSFTKFWKWFRDKVRWYVPETKTIIATKR
ncbi:MAG: hypothetical protein NZ992_03360 [Candidatus Korarchaeum sp.]|nr:hypothetical protein [Candidatus Korarchaeum sp.]MDW8035899.1 hypothetical protein [Candidatus Korarchaeum sp.]